MNSKMNKESVVSALLLALLLLCTPFVLSSCGSDDDDDNGESGSSSVGNNKTEPIVTAGYEDVTAGSVTIYGYTNHEKAYDPIVEFGIVISPTPSKTGEGLYELTDTDYAYGSTLSNDNKYKVTFEGLAPNTTYYYCAYQKLGNVRYFGKVRFFTTNPLTKSFVLCDEPIVTHFRLNIGGSIGYASTSIDIPFVVDILQMGSAYSSFLSWKKPYIEFSRYPDFSVSLVSYDYNEYESYNAGQNLEYDYLTGKGKLTCFWSVGNRHYSEQGIRGIYHPLPNMQIYYRLTVPLYDEGEYVYSKSFTMPSNYYEIKRQ